MKRFGNLLISFVLIALMFACTKEGSDGFYSAKNEHIKSVSTGGKIVHKYLYDHAGNIVEQNCLYYFKKYIYDENDRLVKVESAMDRSLFSSTYTVPRTEFMTSQNSTVDSYSLYEYDKEGRLSKIKHYFNETGKGFEYRSMQTFEYEGSFIVKVNWHAPEGHITQFDVYTYDVRGNVANDKYYSNLFGSEEELISETSYKYDSYKNPYRIFSMLGYPGLYMNTNNIIETSLTRHSDVPGFDKYSISETTYKYNNDGYPIKEITEDSEFEYNY